MTEIQADPANTFPLKAINVAIHVISALIADGQYSHAKAYASHIMAILPKPDYKDHVLAIKAMIHILPGDTE